MSLGGLERMSRYVIVTKMHDTEHTCVKYLQDV